MFLMEPKDAYNKKRHGLIHALAGRCFNGFGRQLHPFVAAQFEVISSSKTDVFVN